MSDEKSTPATARGATMDFNSTGSHMYVVTPSDSADLPFGGAARALRINGAGDLRFTSFLDVTDTIPVYDGELILCGVRRVWATGTTATGIRAYV